jgi:hypothetical protein
MRVTPEIDMGLYKICEHTGRMRDRCEHAWWGSFRGIRVSLPKWANRDIHTKAEAQAVLDEVRNAIREGTFDARGLAPREVSPMTFREFAEIYKQRHAVAKRLSLARALTGGSGLCLRDSATGRSGTSRPPTSKTSSPISASRASLVSAPRSGVSRRPRSTARSSCFGTC